ncbi:MAG: branched-chain amino acid ABC transporter permease [Chlorobium sp.]
MEYFYHILVMAGLYVVITTSLNLAVGFTGLPAMGHSAFFLVGAYTSALLALKAGLSPWFTLFLSGVMGWSVGWIVGILTVRLMGDFLALATFSFAVICHSIANNWSELTRGPMGLPGIPSLSFWNIEIDTSLRFLPVVVGFCIMAVVISSRIVSSPYGRILQGIREGELVVFSLGLNVLRYKRQIFAFSALCVAIAGALYAHYITFIDPSSFTPMESFVMLLMVVFGGMGSLSGSVLGAVLLVVIPEALRFTGIPGEVAAPLRQVLYGGILIGLVLYRPQGLLGTFRWK